MGISRDVRLTTARGSASWERRGGYFCLSFELNIFEHSKQRMESRYFFEPNLEEKKVSS